MKRILKYFKPNLPLTLLGILLVGLSALVELYQIRVMGNIIDIGIANADMNLILKLGGLMILVAIVGVGVALLGLIIPATVTNRVAHRLRSDLYEKIQKFSVKNVNKFQTASLITRLTNDVDFIQRTALMTLRMFVRAPVLLVSTVYLTYITNRSLSRIPMVAVILLAIAMGLVVTKGFPKFIRVQDRLDKLNKKIQESLMNIRVIKSFVREDYEDQRFSEENKEYYGAALDAHNLMLLIDPALSVAINFSTVLIMWFASFLILDQQTLTIGDLLVFVNYLRFTMFSMNMMTHVFMMFTRSKASLMRINAVFDEVIDISNKEDAIVTDLKGHIEFRNVSFKYYEEESVKNTLSNLSFTIKPGEKIGIIGSTGSGKTTLVNLLGRLIDPTEGQIFVDGLPISDYDIKSLRKTFGFVPQKNVLFSGTIASNLRLGNPDADVSLMDKVTKAASIHAFIEDSIDGYDTVVQQGGVNFSGGQRQRLCIARALAIDPKVLILDDSTSALDAATEGRVRETVNEEFKGLTLISVAQKISSVANMDRIIVLNEGVIVGYDTHDNLLESSSVYQEIYQSQMRNGVSA